MPESRVISSQPLHTCPFSGGGVDAQASSRESNGISGLTDGGVHLGITFPSGWVSWVNVSLFLHVSWPLLNLGLFLARGVGSSDQLEKQGVCGLQIS